MAQLKFHTCELILWLTRKKNHYWIPLPATTATQFHQELCENCSRYTSKAIDEDGSRSKKRYSYQISSAVFIVMPRLSYLRLIAVDNSWCLWAMLQFLWKHKKWTTFSIINFQPLFQTEAIHLLKSFCKSNISPFDTSLLNNFCDNLHKCVHNVIVGFIWQLFNSLCNGYANCLHSSLYNVVSTHKRSHYTFITLSVHFYIKIYIIKYEPHRLHPTEGRFFANLL